MKKITAFMMVLMVVTGIVLGGCSEDTTKKDIHYSDDSIQKDLKEEKPVEKIVEEDITPPSYYLNTWENDGSIEVTYNEELKQFEIMFLDA